MFDGVTTALITPFDSDGNVDYNSFRSFINFQIQNKVNGLLVLGTTGESPTLNNSEKEDLIKITINEAKDKVFVMVGTGSNCTKTTIENSKKAELLGADCLLVVTPYYNKPTNDGIFLHFKNVAESVNIPIIIYNIPGRTGKNIDTQLMKKLSEIKNIVGVKESSGSITQISEVIEEATNKNNFTVLSGDDGYTLPAISLGAKGVVSVISNAFPKQVVELTNAALQNDLEKAKMLHHNFIMPITRLAFLETNPIPIKYICNKLGLAKDFYRLPMCQLEEKNKIKIDSELKNLKLI